MRFLVLWWAMMMMIAPNFRVRKGGKERGEVKGEYERIFRGGGRECWLRRNGATQSATCASCVKEVKWGFGSKGLRIVAAFWAGIPVEVTQEAGIVPSCRRAAIGTRFLSPHTTRRKTVGVFYSTPTGGMVVLSFRVLGSKNCQYWCKWRRFPAMQLNSSRLHINNTKTTVFGISDTIRLATLGECHVFRHHMGIIKDLLKHARLCSNIWLSGSI